MTALRTLIEAVERGFGRPTNWRDFAELEQPFRAEGEKSRAFSAILAHRAYHGSVDAALALMEAVLPGWSAMLATCGETEEELRPLAAVFDTRNGRPVSDNDVFKANADTPARALFLAILKAMEATNAGKE